VWRLIFSESRGNTVDLFLVCIINNMNCTELDDFAREVQVGFNDHGGWVSHVAVVSLLLTAAVLLPFGDRVIHPLAAVVGGMTAGGVTFASSMYFGDLMCEIRLGIAGAAAVLAALLALCLFKKGLFLLGAAAFATLAHLIYDALPLPENVSETSSFVILGRSGYYYIALSLSGLVGGIVAYVQQRNFARIGSSLIGSGCLILAVSLLLDMSMSPPLPSVAMIAILVCCTLAGVTLQTHLSKRRKRVKKRTKEKDATRDIEE